MEMEWIPKENGALLPEKGEEIGQMIDDSCCNKQRPLLGTAGYRNGQGPSGPRATGLKPISLSLWLEPL
jgi:hypothetical protein